MKVADRRYRVELPGGDVFQFSYREKARKWDPHQLCHVDFDPEEDRYLLTWDGIFVDSFVQESDILLLIIRFGYSINDQHLVPSEILADFNLAYEAGDWVDEWGCRDQHEVVFAIDGVQRPRDRNIRFGGYPRITPKIPKYRNRWFRGQYYDNSGMVYNQQQRSRRQAAEVAARIEIPKLDFEELEKPRKRRITVPRSWGDPSPCAWGGFMPRRGPEPTFRPDEECVFTLKSGKAAEEAHKVQKELKTRNRDLQE